MTPEAGSLSGVRIAIREQGWVFVGVIASAAAAAGLIWAFRRPIECGSHTDLGPYVAGLSAACLVGCICQAVLNRRTNQPLAWAIGLGALAGFAAFQLDALRWVGSCSA